MSGIATGASWLCYFKALQNGNVNKVVPIDKSSTILTILLACIFFHEGLSLVKLGCVCLIGLGKFDLIKIRGESNTKQKLFDVWILSAAGKPHVFAGFTSILGKIGISGIDSNLGTAIRTSVVLVMSWLMVFVKNKQSEIKSIDIKDRLIIYYLIWLCDRNLGYVFIVLYC